MKETIKELNGVPWMPAYGKTRPDQIIFRVHSVLSPLSVMRAATDPGLQVLKRQLEAAGAPVGAIFDKESYSDFTWEGFRVWDAMMLRVMGKGWIQAPKAWNRGDYYVEPVTGDKFMVTLVHGEGDNELHYSI